MEKSEEEEEKQQRRERMGNRAKEFIDEFREGRSMMSSPRLVE